MLIQADARHLPLRDGCVQCVVTSPPYWGLRDYGQADQIGLEATPAAYVANLVQVFGEVRRVLADDGVVWLNLGSSYMSGGERTTGRNDNGRPEKGRGWAEYDIKRTKIVLRDTDPIQSLSSLHVPAYGSDGTALRDLMDVGSVCSGLCDGCLVDFQSHRERIAGSGRRTAQSEQLPTLTGRDNGRLDCALTSPGVSLLDVPASMLLQSWLQHRGECSRCDSRASALSELRSSSDDVQPFAHMTWLNYISKLKHKDMVPTPWMVAMALQADGWYLRSDVIWSKANPMPESVTDRPTKAHEYLFLLTKSERYFYDQDAIREPYARVWDETNGGSLSPDGKHKAHGAMRERGGAYPMPKYNGQATKDYDSAGAQNPSDTKRRVLESMEKYRGANKRSVWTINTMPYAGAHFATMPEKLVEPCILAGSRFGDLVFDPFSGSGTVLAVAERLGRRGVGTDLNPAYHQLAKARTAQRGLRFEDAERHPAVTDAENVDAVRLSVD